MMDIDDSVVLVDHSDSMIGVESRLEAHRLGKLHRAVSVFAFNPDGMVLLQRRAAGKASFAGKWANSCCTHPRRGEGVVAAGERRLVEEMGMRVDLEGIGSFIYRAEDPVSGLVEHELDHVLIGVTDAEPQPNPHETDACKWVFLEDVRDAVSDLSTYAPWLGEALSAFPHLGPPVGP